VRSNAAVFGILAVFCTIADIVYWFGSKDPTGTTALGISAGLGILISFYLYFTVSRIGEQPQDINDAEIADGAGELGHFSPASWWPLVIAASALLVFLGIEFGIWLSLIGGIFSLGGVAGMLFENLHPATAPEPFHHSEHPGH